MTLATSPETTSTNPDEDIRESLPADESGLPPAAPDADVEAAPDDLDGAPPPVPDLVPRSDFEALQEKLTRIEGTLNERQTQEQQAADRAFQEKQAKDRVAVQQQLLDYGLPAEHATVLTDAVELYAFMQSPQGKQRMEQFQQNEAYRHTYDQIFDAFPPNTTIATARQHFNEVSKLPTAQQREWMVKQLAQQQRERNRQGNIQSGRETAERGQPASSGGATDFVTLRRKFGEGTATPAEEERYLKMRSGRQDY